MRPTAAIKVLLAGLLTGGMIASGATPALATLHDGVASARPAPTPAITVRLAAPFVTVGEPVVLTAQLRKATADVLLTVQRRNDDGTWTPLTSAATGSDGRALAALDTSVAGPQVLRVTGAGTSAAVTLTVSDGVSCTPKIALVDKLATPAARCLAARLDRWKSAGLMGVGQQLNVSSLDYSDPLDALEGRRVPVVGFDLEELDKAGNYEFPFASQVLDFMVLLADEGTVLSVSWHANNPHSGESYSDRSWHNLAALLDPSTPEYTAFWDDFASKLAYLKQLQEAGVAVVFRPFHEANGGWFWWGHPDPATYKKLWSRMQSRAAAEGVHNIVWGYSFNAVTNKTITDPTKLLPAKVDLAGMDSYDDESKSNPKDDFVTTGYAAVAAKVSRMTITEAGPMGSVAGTWNPSIVSWRARGLQSKPAWAMLWYDDANGKKQLSSLGPGGAWGTAWLDSCINGFCDLK